ncbi:hypothetical protein CEXT_543121 [Caerostris extrusa]|uniref:Ribosomal protein L20 n=1 Tax=Caerostris extrusa TaxID=172846 RepID=A0AAV4TFW4_CAEEX|nr:hypothetical protein CEXT_543121 [Caerostris extrusa]
MNDSQRNRRAPVLKETVSGYKYRRRKRIGRKLALLFIRGVVVPANVKVAYSGSCHFRYQPVFCRRNALFFFKISRAKTRVLINNLSYHQIPEMTGLKRNYHRCSLLLSSNSAFIEACFHMTKWDKLS